MASISVRHRAALLVGSLLLAGCVGFGQPPPLAPAAVELSDTVFHPQRAYHCGPAALATVLDSSGVRLDPDQLADSLYIPEREGTLQVELVAAARRQGRVAVELDGGPQQLVDQLRAGRPVLVLQNLAVSFYPVWHYAVVVGYQPEPQRFVLRSGGKRRAVVSRRRFESTWRRADYWGLVVLAPDADAAGLPVAAYLQAAADLENTGAHAQALTAFRSAAAAWPEHPLAQLGIANNLYYLGLRPAAEAAYRGLLARYPNHPVAVHNLIMLLLEQDRPCAAREVLAGAAPSTGALMETARRAVAEREAGCDAASAVVDDP